VTYLSVLANQFISIYTMDDCHPCLISIDFHEGEGALGFFLGLILAWLWMSILTWFAIYGVKRIACARE
jgi:hypothetical protein